MFERFILASSLQRIEKRFSMAQLPELSYTPTYNIKPGNITLAIAQGQNHQFKQFKFTVPANPLLAHLGQKRMPVILQSNDEHTWVNAETPLSGILQAITQYPANLMNAYPVPVPLDAVNNASLVQPTGNPIYQEQKEFMQSTRKHKKVYSSSISFSDRLKL